MFGKWDTHWQQIQNLLWITKVRFYFFKYDQSVFFFLAGSGQALDLQQNHQHQVRHSSPTWLPAKLSYYSYTRYWKCCEKYGTPFDHSLFHTFTFAVVLCPTEFVRHHFQPPADDGDFHNVPMAAIWDTSDEKARLEIKV